MIEIKNNFLGSKMNKDIDDRLLPKNQYRHAVNLQINRSDNSDAGTVQNVLGNSIVKNFRTLVTPNVPDLDCIGIYADPSTDTLFIFLTNNTNNAYNKDAKNYIYSYNSISNTAVLLVQGAFLNFSKNNPILGINVLENFLFWTDNRNQPRKININKANPQSLAVPTYYVREEQISVAKPNPLYPPLLYKASTEAPGEYETTMYNVADRYLPTGTTVDDENPYYDPDYIGDAAYLEDKFVRFSYRYKFEDGEDSIIAPFTQIAYIPKQDGYFMYTPPLSGQTEPIKDDETAAYRSTIVNFMQNKVDQVKLQIALPCPANKLLTDFKILNIEILYKDANEIAVSVIDSIPVTPQNNGSFFDSTATVYEYVYNSKKPFKTLPTKDLIRVNDVVPIKALGQEIISNRVVYSNFQNKASYPRYLNYNVGYGNKSPFVNGTSRTSKIEYPNHSLKENRNYQVGVVLADRFGRESGVILSNAVSSEDASQFGASSLYVKYRDLADTAPSWYPGSALKVLFNSPIQSGPEGWPGLYNGDDTSPNYNPLGWYSYKIVVKQTEQDYYNVYFPGFMAAYPGTTLLNGPTTELGKTSHVVLINDNINKVPRDLTEVGPAQLQFRSSVVLYPRVSNNVFPYNNQQAYPGNTYSFVNTIATNNSLFFGSDVNPDISVGGYDQFYQVDSNPLIARLSTPSQLGVVYTADDVVNLSIAETKPFDSRLDVYWETSTVGIISELNELIDIGTNGATDVNYSTVSFSEASSGEFSVVNDITFTDEVGDPIVLDSSQVALTLVEDGTGSNITNKFQLLPTATSGEFTIKTTNPGYFTYQSPTGKNQFEITLTSTSGVPAISVDYPINLSLTNVAPTITYPPINQFFQKDDGTGNQDIVTFTGVNGSADPSNTQLGLVWSIDPPVNYFSIAQTGILTADTNALSPGNYTVNVKLTDAGGLIMTRSVDVGISPDISQYTLTGAATTGTSFQYLDAAANTQYAELAPGVTISRCMQIGSASPTTGVTLVGACETVPNECAVFMLNGGTSGRTFIYYAPGASVTTTLVVPANQSYTKYIKTPYNAAGAIQMANATATCPVPVCRKYTLSGGTNGRTFNFDDCYTGLTTLTIAPNQSVERCIQSPYYADGAVNDNVACPLSTLCYNYTLNGGPTGHTFTYTPCGETTTVSVTVPANGAVTRCIGYGFYDSLAVKGAGCAPPPVCSYTSTGNNFTTSTNGTTTLSGTITPSECSYSLRAIATVTGSATTISSNVTVAGITFPYSSAYVEQVTIGSSTSNGYFILQPGVTYTWNATVIKSGSSGGSGGITISALET